MAKIKYLEDYVPYMKNIYPFLSDEAILEMMEDSFGIIKKALINPREVSLSRIGSQLFDDKTMSGNFKISTVFNKKYSKQIIGKINKQRDKKDGKNNE